MSVRMHYPEVFVGSSAMDLIILMIRLKASVISNKDLIGRFRMAEHEDKRHIAEGPTQSWQ
jgi:hypothetical protein